MANRREDFVDETQTALSFLNRFIRQFIGIVAGAARAVFSEHHAAGGDGLGQPLGDGAVMQLLDRRLHDLLPALRRYAPR